MSVSASHFVSVPFALSLDMCKQELQTIAVCCKFRVRNGHSGGEEWLKVQTFSHFELLSHVCLCFSPRSLSLSPLHAWLSLCISCRFLAHSPILFLSLSSSLCLPLSLFISLSSSLLSLCLPLSLFISLFFLALSLSSYLCLLPCSLSLSLPISVSSTHTLSLSLSLSATFIVHCPFASVFISLFLLCLSPEMLGTPTPLQPGRDPGFWSGEAQRSFNFKAGGPEPKIAHNRGFPWGKKGTRAPMAPWTRYWQLCLIFHSSQSFPNSCKVCFSFLPKNLQTPALLSRDGACCSSLRPLRFLSVKLADPFTIDHNRSDD